ncbi:MAG TPA: thiamine pyrophosphate-dependent enzyme [Noviherbaspirillum sp.]|nr:thiamine pyrophosphate-dependent enzyme [Noviherbaspirillum sp.]
MPAAGFTHAASGIGEALLDGIPMLIFSGGIRTDTGKRYQLYDIDQMALAKPLTKAAFRVLRHEDVVPTIFEAYRIATSGEPGPVLIEIPVNLELFPGEVGALPKWSAPAAAQEPDRALIRQAADLLLGAKKPGLFVGWAAGAATDEQLAIAELLQAPVSTTLQGLSTFPGDHPLHAGFAFSPSAVPAAIGAKLAQPDLDVFAIVGDGCFMMTCMEIVTAAANRLGVIYFVFNDGELSQIAQAQQMLYNRKPCTVLDAPNLEGITLATGAAYVAMQGGDAIASAISEARRLASAGRPVIVNVAIDYSKRTSFTGGTAKSNFRRFPLSQRVRFAGRALMRKVTG